MGRARYRGISLTSDAEVSDHTSACPGAVGRKAIHSQTMIITLSPPSCGDGVRMLSETVPPSTDPIFAGFLKQATNAQPVLH